MEILTEERYPFSEPQTAYAFGALAPSLDEETVRYHVTVVARHHAQELNLLLSGYPALQTVTLAELCRSRRLPPPIGELVSSHARALFCHHAAFRSLSPHRTHPSPALVRSVKRTYVSLATLLYEMEEAALHQTGSGFLWLLKTRSGAVRPALTRDHELPKSSAGRILAAIDLWEHAYFGTYRSDKGAYVRACLGRLDWDTVNAVFDLT